ncbi:unnamed protein product [Jaminaea pallidilutea]
MNGIAEQEEISARQSSIAAASERARFPEPPKDVLSVLKTFMEVQERRVQHWKEYQEAMDGHLASGSSGQQQNGALEPSVDGDAEAVGPQVNGHAHAQSEDPSIADPAAPGHIRSPNHSHYASSSVSVPLADPNLMNRIISLVTSGLIDCGHETRTIALTLKDAGGGGEASSSSPTSPLYRPDLARIIDSIQDCENQVLRSIVRRDQLRRGWKAAEEQERASSSRAGASRGADDQGEERQKREAEEEEVERIEVEIKGLREEKVAGLLEELRGEMTDLTLA